MHTRAIFVDMDEFIVPFRHDGVYQLVDELMSRPPHVGALKFEGRYTRPLDWAGELQRLARHTYDTFPTITFDYLRQMRVADNYDYLPKWIVRPAAVTRLSVHEVTEMARVHNHNATAQLNYTRGPCPETIGLKYHFRRPLQGGTR